MRKHVKRSVSDYYNQCCKLKFLSTAFRTLSLILLYYCFSIGLTFYQKWFIKSFQYPLTVVIFHLTLKYMFASFLRACYEFYWKQQRVLLNWRDYTVKIGLVGFCSAMDIGLSNWSFEFITVSLYTMSKSSCIVFILMFALLFGLEKFRWSLVVIISLIALGLFMFTYHSTQFNFEGFLLVMLASVTAGLRWTLAQLVMQKKEIGLNNPLDMVYHVQPWMILSILPLAIYFEGMPVALTQLFRYKNADFMTNIVFLMLFGGVIAFFMELAEYLLLSYTSSLTVSISGIIKEILTLILAVEVNHDLMNAVNIFGLIMCILGIMAHVISRATNVDEDTDDSIRSDDDSTEMRKLLTTSVSDDDDDNEDEIIFDLNTLR